MREQQKFLRREIERNPGARCFVPSHVDFQIVDAQTFCLALGSTAQYRPHPGEQFSKSERFDQIIVCAQLESFHTVAHTVPGGEKENGHANPIASELRNQFPAVLAWQHDIDDQKIEFFCARLLRSGFTIGRNVDRKTGFAQSLGQESSRLLFVLDYENPHNQKKNFEANLNDQEKFEMGNAKRGTT